MTDMRLVAQSFGLVDRDTVRDTVSTLSGTYGQNVLIRISSGLGMCVTLLKMRMNLLAS